MVVAPDIWTPRRGRRLLCAPPPMGLARAMWSSGGQVGPPLPTAYPNLFQWLRPTVGVTLSGSNVTDAHDQSGGVGGTFPHDANSVQSGVTISGGTINGKTCFSVPSGGTTGLSTSSTVGPYTQFFNCTLFAVLKPSSLGNFFGVYDNNNANSFSLAVNATSSKWKFVMNDNSSPYGLCEGGTPAIGTAVLLTAIFVGSTHTATLQVNGTTVSTDTSMPAPTLSSASALTLGGRPTVTLSGVPGLFGESAVYTDAKAGTDLLELNRYFGNLYGITVP